jgi:hypothetical protein
MLTVERCRLALGSGCMLSDTELERVRDDLYALARIAIEGLPKAAASNDLLSTDEMLRALPEAERVDVMERAAIIEFDGHRTRDDAERLARPKARATVMSEVSKTGPTGPRTAEGKAVASRNALKHGLLSRLPVLPDEDEEVFLSFKARFHEALRPQEELELLLVERIVVTAWRLRRLERVEAGILAWHYYEEVRDRAVARLRSHETTLLARIEAQEIVVTDAKAHEAARVELSRVHDISRQHEDVLLGRAFIRDGLEVDALTKLARYEAGLERTLYRALHELRRLQSMRPVQSALAPEGDSGEPPPDDPAAQDTVGTTS